MANEGNTLTFDPTPRGDYEVRKALQVLRKLVPISTFTATRHPKETDDITKGWQTKSFWICDGSLVGSGGDPMGLFICVTNPENNAQWAKIVQFSTDPATGDIYGDPGQGQGSGSTIPVDRRIIVADGAYGDVAQSTVRIDALGGFLDTTSHIDIVFVMQAEPFAVT